MVNSSFRRRVLPWRSLPPHHFETSRMQSKTWCDGLASSIVAVWLWLVVISVPRVCLGGDRSCFEQRLQIGENVRPAAGGTVDELGFGSVELVGDSQLH